MSRTTINELERELFWTRIERDRLALEVKRLKRGNWLARALKLVFKRNGNK